jgi:hypothetical protein
LASTVLPQQAVAPPGPSHSTARRGDALPLLSGVLPTVYLVLFPARAIGRSDLAGSPNPQCCSGRAVPEIPMVEVNLGLSPLAPRALTFQLPECRNSDVMRVCHLDSTMSPGSHSATSPSGLRGSRNPRLQVLGS